MSDAQFYATKWYEWLPRKQFHLLMYESYYKMNMVAYTFSPSTQEAEADISVNSSLASSTSQPGLCRKILSLKNS